MGKVLVALIVFGLSCAEPARPSVRRPQPGEEPDTPAFSIGLSKVLEAAPNSNAAEGMELTYRAAYAEGRLDGLRYKMRILSKYRALACLGTVTEVMEDIGLERAQAATTSCAAWENNDSKDAEIPGPAYAKGRVQITRKVAAEAPSLMEHVVFAFETGYKAAVDDQETKAEEMSAASHEACRIALKNWTSRTDDAVVCSKVFVDLVKDVKGPHVPE